jgi:diguanylate cyclase (GGDEF)-like protein
MAHSQTSSKPTVPEKASRMTADAAARAVSRRWALAGIAGMTFAVAVAFSGIFKHMPPALAASLTIACGWLMMLLLSPWRRMQSIFADDRQTLRQLNLRLRMIAEGNRNIPLKDLLIDRPDEIGELSRIVHDLAAEAVSARLQNTLMQRRMDDDVQKQTRRATAHLEKQVATDPLTQLGNRRALEQRMSELLDFKSRSGRLLTVMAIDFDGFKSVNDKLGHEIGDRCLQFLGQLLKTSLRKEDLAIRLGGDEFVVLMPDQTLDAAQHVANRLASLFAQMPWHSGGLPRPTLSVGLACDRCAPSSSAAAILRKADAALYASKNSGRAVVSTFGEAA